MLESLREPAGPADRGADSALDLSDPKEKFLAVLGQKSGAGLQVSGLPMSTRFDHYCSPDRIAVAFCSAQAECDRVANVLDCVAQYAKLRCVSVLEDNFQPPVVVQVGQDKCAAVIRKVQSGCARDF